MCRSFLLAGLVLLLSPALTPVNAQTNATGPSEPKSQVRLRAPHDKSRVPTLNSDGLAARIVVKFHEGTGVVLGPGGLEVALGFPQISHPEVPQLQRLEVEKQLRLVEKLARRHGYPIASLIEDSRQKLQSWKRRSEVYWGQEMADLSLYFQLVLEDWGQEIELSRLVNRLNALESIEIAYAEPLAFPGSIEKLVANPPAGPFDCSPADISITAPNLESDQGYLSPAPTGIDAFAAWSVPGGDGAGIRVIDIEAGYFEHADIPLLLSSVGHPGDCYGNGWNDACRKHGRSVLGILKAKDNGEGTTGIAHGASVGIRSIVNTNVHPDGSYGTAVQDSFLVSHNIYWGAQHSIQGVVLLELHRNYETLTAENCGCNSGSSCSVVAPVEFWPAEFDTIQQAVGNGVVVVEAAGNGGLNLDDGVFGGHFEPGGPDSGAILVTGSESALRVPLCSSGAPNTGSGIHLHAWGEEVATTGWETGDNLHEDGHCNSYHGVFNGSSSASAIVAGAVASLQGVALAQLGAKLSPGEVREVLVNTGTPQDLGASDPAAGPIGPQPNLQAAIEAILE